MSHPIPILFPSIFGPISVDYCFLFYGLSFFSMTMLVLTVFYFLYLAIFTKGFFTSPLVWLVLQFIVFYFVMYLQERLFYNMCTQSLSTR